MVPSFSELLNGKVKKRDSRNDKPKKSTEDDHLKGVSDVVKEIYLKIKVDVLASDVEVVFNPKALYISMRKNKNLAFFKFGIEKITLVVLCPEEETRKRIKHHEIKTLTEKVQQFWNGPSCSIVIDSMEKLNEVTTLLKRMIKEQE